MTQGHPTDDSSATAQGHTSESTVVDIDPMSEDQPPKYTPSGRPIASYPTAPPPPKKPPQNSYGAINGDNAAGQSTEGSPLLGNESRPRSRPRSVNWNNVRDSLKLRRNRCRAWGRQNTFCVFLIILTSILPLFILILWWFDCFAPECVVPKGAEVVTMSQTIDPVLYSELTFRLEDGISGDINVVQSRDINADQIQIIMSMKASTPDMLSHMANSLQLNTQKGRADSNLFMNMTAPILKKALYRNCTSVYIDIIFPRNITEFRALEIQSSFKGNVFIMMDDFRLTNKMVVTTIRGDVEITDTSIGKELSVKSSGSIKADVKAMSLVNLEARGKIGLELASRSPTLYVKAKSTSSKVIVFLTKTFNGRFSLKSSELPVVNGPCCIFPTYKDNHTFEGYVSKWDDEPGYLPRVEMKGYATKLNLVF
ncbi:hypothetical protein EMPS_09627 [Entomortierella parvispora]|uniref:Uncharacterized protein n=1 Tax=Entomortierella parvispora TaxID=205924 RepID=A0A9P3HIX9_9FUNG|nr:hypothetical protein EMPS_09627 [Entomortierella parvispora]